MDRQTYGRTVLFVMEDGQIPREMLPFTDLPGRHTPPPVKRYPQVSESDGVCNWCDVV